jgi:hypothetical protein
VSEGLFGCLQSEVAAREKSPGLSMRDVMNLPAPLNRLAQWLLREEQATAAGIAGFLGGDAEGAQAIIADWLEQGYLREVAIRDETYYVLRTASKRPREVPLDLWAALQKKVEE